METKLKKIDDDGDERGEWRFSLKLSIKAWKMPIKQNDEGDKDR